MALIPWGHVPFVEGTVGHGIRHAERGANGHSVAYWSVWPTRILMHQRIWSNDGPCRPMTHGPVLPCPMRGRTPGRDGGGGALGPLMGRANYSTV